MPPIRPDPYILLDQNAPKRMIRALPGHRIVRAYERGWSQLTNGDLIEAAEKAGFDIIITADKNLRHQQNLTGRSIAILVLETNRWEQVKDNLDLIADAIGNAERGSFAELMFPRHKGHKGADSLSAS